MDNRVSELSLQLDVVQKEKNELESNQKLKKLEDKIERLKTSLKESVSAKTELKFRLGQIEQQWTKQQIQRQGEEKSLDVLSQLSRDEIYEKLGKIEREMLTLKIKETSLISENSNLGLKVRETEEWCETLQQRNKLCQDENAELKFQIEGLKSQLLDQKEP